MAEAHGDAEGCSVALTGAELLAPSAVPECVPQVEALAQPVPLPQGVVHAVGAVLAEAR